MELEEAIEILQKIVEINNGVIKEARKNGDINTMQLTADLDNQSIAIEIVLQELENSIPKKKIEEMLEDYQERKRYYGDENIEKDNDYFSIEEVIEVLQELLKEE